MIDRRPTVESEQPTPQSQPDAQAPTGPIQVLRGNLKAIGVMLLAVTLQVLGALLLKTIADHRLEWSIAVLAIGVSAVIFLNLVRLSVWGAAHKRFPLSTTFPLSSLFYPVMLVVALAYGDAVGSRQLLGALLITSGSVWLSLRVRA